MTRKALLDWLDWCPFGHDAKIERCLPNLSGEEILEFVDKISYRVFDPDGWLNRWAQKVHDDVRLDHSLDARVVHAHLAVNRAISCAHIRAAEREAQMKDLLEIIRR
jgi:hypothetical protein